MRCVFLRAANVGKETPWFAFRRPEHRRVIATKSMLIATTAFVRLPHFLCTNRWQKVQMKRPTIQIQSKSFVSFSLPHTHTSERQCLRFARSLHSGDFKNSIYFGVEKNFEIEIYRRLKEFMAWNAWHDTVEWILVAHEEWILWIGSRVLKHCSACLMFSLSSEMGDPIFD